jgi:hypothetical protein
MNRTVRCLWLLLPVANALGACSADSGNRPTYTSGLNGNATLGNLTPSQQSTICTTQAAFLRANIDTTSLTRFWCAFTPGVLTAQSDAACQSAMDACVNAFSIKLDVTVTDPNAPPPQCVTSTSSCNGTVRQYEDCVNALADFQISIGTDWACGKRTQYPSSPTVGIDACNALGPSCSAVTGAPNIQ